MTMNSHFPANIEGRMTFFVQPSVVIQQEMISELIKWEYEVYLVHDVANAKRIFYQYPNCLALLNIDNGLSEAQCLKLVREVQQDPLLRTVTVGILTYRQDDRGAGESSDSQRFPCEFFRLSQKARVNLKIITNFLDANQAKGRRRFLRIRCDRNARLSFRDADDLIDGHILDLSSAGMTCILYPDKRWPKRSALASIRLELEKVPVRLAESSSTIGGLNMAKEPSTSSFLTPRPKTPLWKKFALRSKSRFNPPSTRP